MVFYQTLENVLMMLFYMAPAYLLTKTGKFEPVHAKGISAILLNIAFPAMIINSFQTIEFDFNILLQFSIFFLIAILLLSVSILICFLILRKKISDTKYRILSIASSLGNVGFLGGPLISSLYPKSPIVLCYSSIYATAMTIIYFTIGVYILTMDKNDMSSFLAIFNQGTISLATGVIIYLAEWHFSEAFGNTVSLLGKMSTPLCMFIFGMRLAKVYLADLFKRPLVYVICLIKLLIFPFISYAIVFFMDLDEEFKASIFILSAAPCDAFILSLAELHNTEQELSDNVVLVSTIISVITLPFIVTFFKNQF